MESVKVGLTLLLPISIYVTICSLLNLLSFQSSYGVFHSDFIKEEYVAPMSPWRWLIALALPLYIARRARRRKTLDSSGAIAAFVVGFILTLSNFCFTLALFTFFLSSSRLTKYKADVKRKLEQDYDKGSERNWVQVVCNGGMATQMALIYLLQVGSVESCVNTSAAPQTAWLVLSVLGALSAAAGDTWSSELGVLASSAPRLITTGRSVPPGTNGGVSLLGLGASAAGGAAVGAAYYGGLLLMSSTPLHTQPAQWPVVCACALAGLLGSLFDSLLGATLQYSGVDARDGCVVSSPGPRVTHVAGRDVLDNHAVNLVTSLVMGLATPALAACVL